METLNSILDLAYEIGFSVVSSFFIYGAVGSFLGFTLTIWIVRKINRAQGFQRAFGIWTFMAKLNMVYLPIVGAIFFGAIAGIYGLNDSINSYIESGVQFSIDQLAPYVSQDVLTTTIAEYGASYMLTDVIDTMFWVAYRGMFIFFFITLLQWPIIEYVAHKVISIFLPKQSSKLSY